MNLDGHGVSLDADWSQKIAELLEAEVVSAGVAPKAAGGFWVLGQDAADRGARSAMGFAGGATARSVFDLASLTKPCVALTAALAIDQGELSWTTPVAEVLPWLAGTRGGQASVEAHLSHRAGLVAHREFFVPQQAGLPLHRRTILRAAAEATRPGPPDIPVYSDLGYLLVGEVLEARLGRSLDEIVLARLTSPRGWAIASARQWRKSGDATFSAAVPTEYVPRRGGWVRGLVHDDNAWALSGSALSGHAGLFGTLPGVLGLARGLLEAALGRGDLAQSAAHLLARRAGGSLRLGLDGVTKPGSSAGSIAGPNTFGHLGFTGTSFWCDPDAGVAVCLLTNRVSPTRENLAIRAARPRVHDGLFRLAAAARTALASQPP